MTQPPPQQTAPPQSLPSPSGPAEPVVNPTPESRLDQLAAEYALIKPQADAKAERLKEITDAIKGELARQLPAGARSILLTSPHLWAPLRLKYKAGSRTLDVKAIKAQIPETVWGPWVKQGQGSWELRAVE